ncbi:MAG: BON domain-containing protein [Phycisphaeraceae bacterium]|nr:MAG: BON domain-containing protein [Phycisphaeraceae bacterium]
MKTFTRSFACIAAGCVVSLSGCDSSENTPARSDTSTTPTSSDRASADNTGRNYDDHDRDAMTPMNQSQSGEHVRTTADIRRAVMGDDMLSTGAKNCKIITDDQGRVWLRGVVYSRDEKDRIESIATRVAGANNVTNELEIKAD